MSILLFVNTSKACEVSGQYFSLARGECRDCPANSNSTESGLTVCPCVEGYYREEGEEDMQCTRELYSIGLAINMVILLSRYNILHDNTVIKTFSY